jgi:hypothetical protein
VRGRRGGRRGYLSCRPLVGPGVLGGGDPSQGQGHDGRGQGEQHRGQRERGGACAQQLAADPAQRFGRAEQPLDPLDRVGGGGGQPRRGAGGYGEDRQGGGQRPGAAGCSGCA